MKDRGALCLCVFIVIGLAVSGRAPHERGTWVLEVAPLLVLLPVVWLTRRHFPLTPLLYVLLALHAIILMVGGHYTYARVPLGLWVQQAFDLSRNHFDRLGHFAQGFVPAIAAREVLLRLTPLRVKGWLFFIATCICLAISACYEFIEWWTALLLGAGADDFLATQGDPWDTQWDMFTALVGAICAQLLLSHWHDRQLRRMPMGTTAP